jgi:hypothetical protein
MTAHARDEVMSVNCSPCWTLGQPLEVNSIVSDAPPASAPSVQPQDSPTAPRPLSNESMMAAFRVLQQQRRTMGEAEAVIEQVVSSRTPESLFADLKRWERT